MVFEYYLSAVFVITVVVLLYALYYGIAYTQISHWIYRKFASNVNETVFHAVFFRLLGFIVFGLLTAFIFGKIYRVKFDFLSLQIEYFDEMIPWILGLFLLTIIIPYLNVKNSKQSLYPQFKINIWTKSYKFLSYITWIFYLMGYEFMFRGVLLFGTMEELGYYLAIILNVTLYALAHLHKGIKEVLGCFILGPILCVIAIHTDNIIIPTILHISVCLWNEYFSIRTEVAKKVVLND